MHGSIIVMVDEKTLQDGDVYVPWEEYEMRHSIPACDYVVRDEGEQFTKAIKSFADCYQLPEIPVRTIEADGERLAVGVLDKPHIQALKKALDEEVARRLHKVREEIEKPNPDLWRIADEAYNNSLVYFVSLTDRNGTGFFNEVSFAEFFDGTDERLYITETFDFHV